MNGIFLKHLYISMLMKTSQSRSKRGNEFARSRRTHTPRSTQIAMFMRSTWAHRSQVIQCKTLDTCVDTFLANISLWHFSERYVNNGVWQIRLFITHYIVRRGLKSSGKQLSRWRLCYKLSSGSRFTFITAYNYATLLYLKCRWCNVIHRDL